MPSRYLLDEWRLDYNRRRPHSVIGWHTPAAYAAQCDKSFAGAVPAATQAVPPVQSTHHQPILSRNMV